MVVFVSKSDIPPQPPLLSPWVAATLDRELQDHFKEWSRDARIIVDHMGACSKWFIHALNPPLGSYSRDRVVLVGDAVSVPIYPYFVSPLTTLGTRYGSSSWSRRWPRV